MSLDNSEEIENRLRNKAIDRQLLHSKQREDNVVKILMLGTGESGKSTLLKQLRIIHSEGFTEEELLGFKSVVLDNLVTSMKYVIAGMTLLRIRLENANNKQYAQQIFQCVDYYDEEYSALSQHIITALKNLWNDRGIREAVTRGFEYELNDSALYFFENMNRITSEKYVPNTADVLRARVRTTGIVETHFKFDNLLFRVIDVGGQRSERRKWIHCFDSVNAVFFVVAISEYDMTLKEDSSVNRLRDSLDVFSSICKNIFFRYATIILFLNKLDLFREKILSSDHHLRYFLPEYSGPDKDCDRAALFIQHHFHKKATIDDYNKEVHSHFTTATDTSNIQYVYRLVLDAIIRENLRHSTLV